MHKSIFPLLFGLCMSLPLIAQSEYSSPVISVGVVVADLDRSMDFYQNVLGMKKVNLYDLNSDFGQRSGLSGGIPVKIEVLKVEDLPGATEWKLMSFGKESQHPQQKWIQDDTGMQYITLMVSALAPFIERIENAEVPFLGDTPTPLDDTRGFVLIQDPDGVFIELIGPME